MDTANNLLLRLHKLAHRNDENFHTEALVHLLHHLLQHEPKTSINILRKLTGGILNLIPEDIGSVSISSQVRTSQGRPDIEIKVKDQLIYVEVKVESGLGDLQLKRYRDVLQKSGFEKTGLILLTRYPIIAKADDHEMPDFAIHWYEIAEWLEHELNRGSVNQTSSIYLIKQSLEFLQARGMTIEQIGQELISDDFIQGLQSLNSLMNMLNHILTLKKISPKVDSSNNYMGYSFKVKSDSCWIGVLYEEPYKLQFETEGEIDEAACEKFSFGYIWIEEGYPMWINELDLSSEEVNFFSLSKPMQLKTIEEFFTKSLTVAKQIQL